MSLAANTSSSGGGAAKPAISAVSPIGKKLQKLAQAAENELTNQTDNPDSELDSENPDSKGTDSKNKDNGAVAKDDGKNVPENETNDANDSFRQLMALKEMEHLQQLQMLNAQARAAAAGGAQVPKISVPNIPSPQKKPQGGGGGGSSKPASSSPSSEKATTVSPNANQVNNTLAERNPFINSIPEALGRAVKQDAKRSGSQEPQAVAQREKAAMSLLQEYASLRPDTNLSINDGKENDMVRQLVMHQVPTKVYNHFLDSAKEQYKNTDKKLDEINSIATRNAIGYVNQQRLEKFASDNPKYNNGKDGIGGDFFKHYAELGFEKGDFNQLKAQQFLDLHQDSLASMKAHSEFQARAEGKGEPLTLADLQKETARQQKQVIYITPDFDNKSAFDSSKEVASLRNMGYTVHPVQGRSELETAQDVKDLSEKIGPSNALVISGHGSTKDLSAARLGDSGNSQSLSTKEKFYLDTSDFTGKTILTSTGDTIRLNPDKAIQDLVRDEGILMDGAKVFCNICNGHGNENISKQDSLAQAIADVAGERVDVYARQGNIRTHGEYFEDKGELKHSEGLYLVAASTTRSSDDSMFDGIETNGNSVEDRLDLGFGYGSDGVDPEEETEEDPEELYAAIEEDDEIEDT